MEPSVWAYQVSLTDCYCVTRKVVFCLLVSCIVTLVCTMYGIVFCRWFDTRGTFQLSPTVLYHPAWLNTSNIAYSSHFLSA